jgi:hypothetical protein
MLLIYILIILFIILVSYQVILAFSSNSNAQYSLIEGLENADTTTSTSSQEYKPYNVSDPNNSLILAQQNAGNIEVLKGRVDKLDGVNDKVVTMQQSIDSMQTQIDGLVQQQADYAQDMAGSTPADVTGTDGETTENVEDSIEEEDQAT